MCGNLDFIFRIAAYILKIARILIPFVLIILIAIDMANVVANANLDEKVKKEVVTKSVKRLIYAFIIFLIPTIIQLVFRQLSDKTPSGYGSGNDTTSWIDCFNEYFLK